MKSSNRVRRAQVASFLAFGFAGCLGALAVSNSGCAAQAQTTGYAEVDAPPVVFTDPPTLVAVDSDVWVVQDYDYPVYYVDGYYWVNRDNQWHRSHSYDGGWARVDAGGVPATIVRRDPHAYVHYRGEAASQRRPAPRESLANEPRRGPPPEHPAEPHAGPPGFEKDAPRPPERAEDHPPGFDKDKGPRPPDHGPEHPPEEHAAPSAHPGPPPGMPSHEPEKREEKRKVEKKKIEKHEDHGK